MTVARWEEQDELRAVASRAIRRATAILECEDPDLLERVVAGDEAAVARVLGCPMCGREPDA